MPVLLQMRTDHPPCLPSRDICSCNKQQGMAFLLSPSNVALSYTMPMLPHGHRHGGQCNARALRPSAMVSGASSLTSSRASRDCATSAASFLPAPSHRGNSAHISQHACRVMQLKQLPAASIEQLQHVQPARPCLMQRRC